MSIGVFVVEISLVKERVACVALVFHIPVDFQIPVRYVIPTAVLSPILRVVLAESLSPRNRRRAKGLKGGGG